VRLGNAGMVRSRSAWSRMFGCDEATQRRQGAGSYGEGRSGPARNGTADMEKGLTDG